MKFSRSMAITGTESPEQIVQLLDEVEAFLGTAEIPDDTIFDLRLALEELLTNIRNHGAADNGAAVAVTLELILETDGIRMIITDSGPPFNPLEVPGPVRSTTERKIGRLGLHLLHSLMEHVSYQRLDGLNCLQMTKTKGVTNGYL